MPIARSKVTAQGQISVPVDVRRKLGVGPGSILEWDEFGGKIVVRRVGGSTFEDIHRRLFGKRKPKKVSVEEIKDAIAQHVSERYARH
jgi:AbrB family looped-hinge helix DNA binding protein